VKVLMNMIVWQAKIVSSRDSIPHEKKGQ
jgi:hypothetical protein